MSIDSHKDTACVHDSTGPSSEEPVCFDFRKRNAKLFAFIVVLWVLLDQLSKAYFNGFKLGEVVAGPFCGVFQFRLVHNTGAAWSMFSDSTFALGVFSLVICVLLLVYLFKLAPDSSVGEAAGLAFVFAGGVGNAIDRFALGYVVDFIDPVFIEFPVFNIADIGVTCGFVLFFAALLYGFKKHANRS